MGVKSKTKFDFIEKDSDDMLNLLAECLSKYEKDILILEYNLSEKEVYKIAEISRDACNYHENGVAILVIYFVKACKHLEEMSKSIS